jgi:hypothetical protein
MFVGVTNRSTLGAGGRFIFDSLVIPERMNAPHRRADEVIDGDFFAIFTSFRAGYDAFCFFDGCIVRIFVKLDEPDNAVAI